MPIFDNMMLRTSGLQSIRNQQVTNHTDYAPPTIYPLVSFITKILFRWERK